MPCKENSLKCVHYIYNDYGLLLNSLRIAFCQIFYTIQSKSCKIMSKHQLINSFLVILGFILSPLSWWNDLLINVPLAYLFSAPFSMINKSLFLPSFIIGYYISNLLGLIMLHWGGKGLIQNKYQSLNIKQSLAVSFIYTIIIIFIVLIGWLDAPSVYLKHLM